MLMTLRKCVEELERQGIPSPTHEGIRKLAMRGVIRSSREWSVWKTRPLWQIDVDSLIKYLKETGYEKKQKSGAHGTAPEGIRHPIHPAIKSGVQGVARKQVRRNHKDGPNPRRHRTGHRREA